MNETDLPHERRRPSTTELVFLGFCVILASIINGINYTSQNIILDEIALSFKVKDGDLQWVTNSYLLAFVSSGYIDHSRPNAVILTCFMPCSGPTQGGTALVSGRAADMFGERVSVECRVEIRCLSQSPHQGRKAVFLSGAVVFGAATLVSLFMRHQTALFAFRGLMGIGAAMLAASSLGRCYDSFIVYTVNVLTVLP